jgi:hypothetical protein
VELININFTKHLLDTIFNAMDLGQTLQNHFQELSAAKLLKAEGKDKEKDKGKGKEKEKSKSKSMVFGSLALPAGRIERTDVNFYPFMIRNKTGKDIQFWLKRVRSLFLNIFLKHSQFSRSREIF